jgi:hypothetical protein
MATYKLITSQTSSGQNIITLSSIPQIYTDLVVKLCARGSANNQYELVRVYINGTSDNAGAQAQIGYETSADTSNFMNAGYPTDSAATANVFGSLDYYFPNYTKASVQKSIIFYGGSEQNKASPVINRLGGIISTQTSAITSLSFDGEYGTFLSGTTIYLYGILAS